ASILIALMIQPLNIADMQPGTASSTVIIMASFMAVLLFFTTGDPYSALIVLAVCIGYAPLDYQGKIMMGEVGNHTFGVALGVLYTYLGLNIASYHHWEATGVFVIVLVLLLITTALIACLRQNNLKIFLEKELKISDPGFGDLFMDVLTGGGLGDLIRKIILRNRGFKIKSKWAKLLGFRRLFHNPYAQIK
ncbi:MAG TPA: cell wall biosynthesis protein, partial [Methanobacterium sp.]|nr:cell wall biosynthesis protein [Methanobacterium sp.]